jgi:hypothetical protein
VPCKEYIETDSKSCLYVIAVGVHSTNPVGNRMCWKEGVSVTNRARQRKLKGAVLQLKILTKFRACCISDLVSTPNFEAGR